MLLPPREFDPSFVPSVTRITAENAPSDWELNQPGYKLFAAPSTSGYVQDVSPTTGLPTGSPTLAFTGIVRDWPILNIPTLSNGPEWGYSIGRQELFFMKKYATYSRALWKAYFNNGVWSSYPLLGGENRGIPWPSKDIQDTTPKILFARLLSDLTYKVCVRLDPDNSATEQQIPAKVLAKWGGPRWIPGTNKVICSILDLNNVEQVAIYDADTQLLEQVTFFAAVHNIRIDETWTSKSPDGFAIWFTVNDTYLYTLEYVVGSWVLTNIISPSLVVGKPTLPYINSPEPFDYQGRSYIIFELASEPENTATQSEIWIGQPNATAANHFRRISPEDLATRYKPESLRLDNRMVGYYLQQNINSSKDIWLAEMGL